MARKEEEKQSKYQSKTVLAGVESEKLQAEGWTVTKIYTNEDNPLQKYHDLEFRSKN